VGSTLGGLLSIIGYAYNSEAANLTDATISDHACMLAEE
jgi:hypothetical protein